MTSVALALVLGAGLQLSSGIATAQAQAQPPWAQQRQLQAPRPGPARAAEPLGTWLTQNGDARIRIARCGAALCGTVAWLRDAVDARTGAPPVDSRNPDPARRNRPILGLRIFAMAADGQGRWSGSIYNADDGQTYRGGLAPRGEQQLEVQGCAGPFCGSETWTRVGR